MQKFTAMMYELNLPAGSGDNPDEQPQALDRVDLGTKVKNNQVSPPPVVSSSSHSAVVGSSRLRLSAQGQGPLTLPQLILQANLKKENQAGVIAAFIEANGSTITPSQLNDALEKVAALWKHDVQVVSVLIAAGAELDHTDAQGRTMLQICQSRPLRVHADQLQKEAMAAALTASTQAQLSVKGQQGSQGEGMLHKVIDNKKALCPGAS